MLLTIMPILAAAQPSGLITAIVEPINHNVQHNTSTVRPGTVLEFPLTADMFAWDGTPGTAGDPVTLSQLNQNNVTVGHVIRQSQVIESVTLSTMTHAGQITASVRVEFAEAFVNVNRREFEITIHLMLNNVQVVDSRIILRGNFENPEITVSAGDDFVNISDGSVLLALDNISDLEIYLGYGVSIFTRVVSGQRYYATATTGITRADMSIIERHPDIHTAVRLNTVGIIPAWARVSLREIGNYYVYNASGGFIGTTNEQLPFANLFYLSSGRLSVGAGGFPAGGPSDADGSGTGATGSMARPVFGDTPRQLAARTAMAEAVRYATSVGSNTARLHVRDVSVISASELQSMFNAASASGLRARYIVDTSVSPRGDAIQGRIEINPALAMGQNRDIYLGVHTSNSGIQWTTRHFERHFVNQLRVIRLNHDGSYGMPVRITARVDIEGMNINNLHFYSYDRQLNFGTRVRTPNYFVDQNGYLHFSTIYGGYIVVSEGRLVGRERN